MENDLSRLVEQGLSTWSIAEKLGFHQSKVRRLLKKHGLETKWKAKQQKVNHTTCECCRKTKTNINKKLCGSCITAIRRSRLKLAMVQYKGGKCIDCELLANLENSTVFDFHHNDPNEKDFVFAGNSNTYTWEEIVIELDKCTLLCCKCHRLRHYQADVVSKQRAAYIKSHPTTKSEIQKLVSEFIGQ